jgi:hypothetical membrane protein
MTATPNRNRQHVTLGALAWLASLQYFIIQLIVARDWNLPYSLAKNTISDLGNTVCGQYGGRFVCSPLHQLMNISFVILGFTMIAGSALIYRQFKPSRAALIGFSCLGPAGFGTILVGLFPENTVSELHVIGAALPFLVGNLGIVILGASLKVSRSLRIYSLLSGIIALAALVLLLNNQYLGLGVGGIERITAYPQTIWLIVFGFCMVRQTVRSYFD